MNKTRKKNVRCIISLLITLCMTMILLPVNTSAEEIFQNGSGNNVPIITNAGISVTFRDGSADLGKVQIKNGDTWTDYSGNGSQSAKAVKIIPNQDYIIDWTGICLRVNGENIITDDIKNQLSGNDGYTLESGKQYALEGVEFRQENTTPGPDPGTPGPDPGPEEGPTHGGYEGNTVNQAVTVKGQADFYINDSKMVNAASESGEGVNIQGGVSFTYGNSGYIDFYMTCFINQRITSLKINGTDYYSQLPTPKTDAGKEALLNACKGQINEFKITVPYSESGYTVESATKWLDDSDADYMVVGNFLWSYTDPQAKDDYIDNGNMELLSITYKNKEYLPSELDNPGTALDWSQTEKGGSAVLPVGAVVKVKLVPDYGYQLTSFGINGGDFGTGDEQSTFTFEIKRGNAHLGAHFTYVGDKVSSSSNAVAGGSIKLGNDMPGGTAQLKISDADMSDNKKTEFSAAAGDYSIKDYLNIDLYNVYYKGSEDANNVWENEVDTLTNDATISVQLTDEQIASGINADNIRIIHNVHDGDEYETIEAESYDPVNKIVTFKTKSFSAYAIATNVTSAGNGSTQEPDDDNDSSSDDSSNDDTATSTLPSNSVSSTSVSVKTSVNNGDISYAIVDDNLKNVIGFTASEIARIKNGASASVGLNVKEVSSTVSAADKKAIEEKTANISGGFKSGMYIDLSVVKTIGGNSTKVTNLTAPVKVSITLPDSLINTNGATNRQYKIVRIHEGQVDVLDAVFDTATKQLSFYTDRFSTYAVVYSDSASIAPKTGDTVNMCGYVLILMFAVLMFVYAGRKMRKIK